MEASQVHLALNHIPLAGIFFSLLLFILSFIFRTKKFEFSAVILLLTSGIFIIPVYLSGEHVEKLVSRKAFVSKYYIQEHEHKAEKALVVVLITTLTAAAWIYFSITNKSYSNIILYMVICLNVLSAWSVFKTGEDGGKIRHDQLRGGSGNHLEMD